MHWATKYIGIGWKFGGRDIHTDGVDCYGLFRYIQKKHYNIQMSEINITKYNFYNVVKEFKNAVELKSWYEVDTPQDGDAVLLRIAKYPNHVGVWIEDGETVGVLHSVEKTGVMFSSKQNLLKAGWKISRYYRHKSKV